MQIVILDTLEEIAGAFPVFQELRLALCDRQSFVEQVLRQQKEGYQIAAIYADDEIIACAGFRFMHTLAWGKILYIDDLITKEKYHGHGYGKALLDYLVNIAKREGCDQIHLDSGYTRNRAHKVYLNYGFELRCHHFALNLK